MSKKLIAFALAGIFALSMVAPAKAATIEELTILFNDLLAKYNVLLAQVGQPTGAAAVCFNTDLQKGMTSDDVKNLQIKLGVTPTSGYFGSITFAAVKTFQTANGIINTGYVGPLTRTALNDLYCKAVTPVTTYPAGCTSAVGFSSTTGLPCSEVTTLPEGCTSAVGFSPTTGAPCSTTVTYPEGCTSAVGFSPTTGLSCAGTTTTTVAPSYGTLSVQSYPVSNPVSTLYGGQTYEVIAGQYKATGSDITLKKVAVQLTASSAFPWTYFSSFSVWDGTTKLAEVASTQANLIENTFAADYTLNISGLSVVIPSGTSKILTVKTTIVPSIVTNKSFTVALPSAQVVFSDTAGVTYTTVTGSVTSQSYIVSNAQASSITVTKASDNPLAGNIIGSTSGTTRQDLLKFNVKVENINATFNSGTITATSTNAAYLTAVELWDGSTLVASAAPGTGGAVSWTNINLPIAAGTTFKTLTVKGVIAQLTSGYATGDTVYISVGPVLTGMDDNSNVATATGTTVTGDTFYIYLVAPVFTLYGTPTLTPAEVDASHTQARGNATIQFKVTPNGGDIYIQQAGTATSTIAGRTVANSTVGNDFTCTGVTLASGFYRIDTEKICSLVTQITYTTTTAAAAHTVALLQAVWATSTTGTLVTQNYGFTTFITNSAFLSY